MSIKHCAYCGEECRHLEGNAGIGVGQVDSYALCLEKPQDAKVLSALGLTAADLDHDLIIPGVIVCDECFWFPESEETQSKKASL